jgi:hypothetical protein
MGGKVSKSSYADTAISYEALYASMLKDPSTRYRLRARMIEDDAVDPVDAMHDAEALLNLATARFQSITSARTIASGE